MVELAAQSTDPAPPRARSRRAFMPAA